MLMDTKPLKLLALRKIAGCEYTALWAQSVAEVLIPPIPVRPGSPAARIAVALRNELQFDLNGAAGAAAPTHRLEVVVSPTNTTLSIDPVSGRPTEQIGGVNVTYKLVEIATGKVVLSDSTFAHVGSDIPGSQQRLASYFVAGT
jgi:LPS-assembly lipoprotein